MIVNRHNYEEYFLLYVDNELDKAQRAAVENFVQQNPDVADEFKMLKHTTLLADDKVRFEPRHSLYKKTSGISLNNYEEYFLLAVDKELNEVEAAELEKFVLQHPQLQEEFSLLQSTIIPTEVVVFANKTILYRADKKERKIPIAFIRISMAASVIGIAASLWMLYKNDLQPQRITDVVVREEKINSTDKKITTPVTQQHFDPLYKQNKQEIMLAISNKQGKRSKVNTNTNTAIVIAKDIEPNNVNEHQSIASVPPIKETITESSSATITNKIINADPADNNVAVTTFAVNQSNQASNIIAQQAVYHEVESEDENNSIYIAGAAINKTKLKALLHKAINFFDRKTTNNDSDKTLQIASFQIKSK